MNRIAYFLRASLLCVDRASREFVALEPGSIVRCIGPVDQQMIALDFNGREILAFAVDVQDRADSGFAPRTGRLPRPKSGRTLS